MGDSPLLLTLLSEKAKIKWLNPCAAFGRHKTERAEIAGTVIWNMAAGNERSKN